VNDRRTIVLLFVATIGLAWWLSRQPWTAPPQLSALPNPYLPPPLVLGADRQVGVRIPPRTVTPSQLMAAEAAGYPGVNVSQVSLGTPPWSFPYRTLPAGTF
jgi:hypothetical protein